MGEDAARKIWSVIDRRIEEAPTDGINAAGEYSETLYQIQQAFVAGMRSARRAAMTVVKE